MDNVDKTLSTNFVIPPPPLCLPCLAVSVVIPMYNAEEFISECLESILKQTFQSFEVIVVDDCSTDNSVAIVESYIPTFNGRLRLAKTEVNSGGGGYIPRNIGLNLSVGEYVIFVDADDFILLSALETLYNAAKEHDADVVYTSVYYDLKKPNTVYIHKDGLALKFRKEGIEDKTALIVDDTEKLFYELLLPGSGSGEGNFPHPWSKFVRRDFLLKNQIFFPDIVTGGDGIWVINVYAYAKRFLRLPISFYFYRRYNNNSISRTVQRTPSERLSYYVSGLILFLKAIYELANKIEVLKENPIWCYEAVRGRYFEEILKRTDEARKELSNQEIYEILYRELDNEADLSYLTLVPFFFSIIDNERKSVNSNLQTIDILQKEIEQIKTSQAFPAISIVIPLYNASEYVSECLNSLLAQTFQNFEVIMVDDCSTDDSVEIIESYIPIFNGRLKLVKMEQNTGSGAIPRNKGLMLSRGEYVYSMDNDDVLTKTALKELYTLAKKYKADVVYCEKYYMSTGVGEEFVKNIRPADKKIQRPPYVSKPIFLSDDLSKRFKEFMERRFWPAPWSKLVRREVIIKNELFFPALKISDDDIWTFGLVFCAKKFLRVPNAVYIRRMRETSITGIKKTPQQIVNFWLNPILLGLKNLSEVMRRNVFFEKNIKCHYAILREFINLRFGIFKDIEKKFPQYAFYETIKKEFGDKLGEYDVLIAMLCSVLYAEKKARNDDAQIIRNLSKVHEEDQQKIYKLSKTIDDNNYAEKKAHNDDAQTIRMLSKANVEAEQTIRKLSKTIDENKQIFSRFAPYFTARVDIKLTNKVGIADMQILSVSDENAIISKPAWFQKDGIGYVISSYTGKLKIVAKSSVDGQIQFYVRGSAVRNPDDKSKRIPYWIDVTKLTMNGQAILDTLTPVWHNKPYKYTTEVKADEEITLQVEWLPHRSDT